MRTQQPVLPTSLYMQQLKDRLGCAAVSAVFWPAQLAGTFQYPTAVAPSTWLLSNMNQYDTNKTDWLTGNATLFYRGDPLALAAVCAATVSAPLSADSSASNSPSSGTVQSVGTAVTNPSHAALTDGAIAGAVVGAVLGAAVLLSAVLLVVYRQRVRAKCA